MTSEQMQTEKATTRYAVVGFVLSIALLPMAIYGCGPEWARWDAAQAVDYFNKGEVDAALYQLRDAIKKSPRDPVLKLTLAERLLEIDQPEEALSLTNAVVDVYPDAERAVVIKSRAMQSLGDFEGALETWLVFDEQLDANERGARSFNQLAYFRALANRDLHLAKRDIEAAIRAVNQSNGLSWKGDTGLTLPIKATVLATLVARCCNGNEEAIEVLTPLIDEIRSQIGDIEKQLTESVYLDARRTFPFQDSAKTLSLRQKLREHENRAAHLLSCRAIVYRDVGERIGSQADRLEVQQLGFDCSQILKNLPDDQTAVFFLQQLSAYLDTRGFIAGMLPWDDDTGDERSNFVSNFSSAVRDINVAIFCSSIDLQSFDFTIRNSVELVQNRSIAKKSGKKQLAVMHNHRLQILERAGLTQLAKVEIEKIEKLGFEPGPDLF